MEGFWTFLLYLMLLVLYWLQDLFLFHFVSWIGFNFFAIHILTVFRFQALSFILVNFYCQFLHLSFVVISCLAFPKSFCLNFLHLLPILRQIVSCSQNHPYQALFPRHNSTDYLILLLLIRTLLFKVPCK